MAQAININNVYGANDLQRRVVVDLGPRSRADDSFSSRYEFSEGSSAEEEKKEDFKEFCLDLQT